MKGYKAFKSNLTCRDYQFSTTQTHTFDGTPILCKQGFHFLGDFYITESQLLTKAQVVKIFGSFNVELVGKINADFSNRCINKDVVEFISSILVKDENDDEVMLTAHYYQNKSDVDSCDSLDSLAWEIAGYSVV